MQRTRQVFASMLDYIKDEGTPTQKRFSWLIESFVEEAMLEMADGNPEQTAAFFKQLSRMLDWIATGDVEGSISLPGWFSGSREMPLAIEPSGDITGETDSANLQAAINAEPM